MLPSLHQLQLQRVVVATSVGAGEAEEASKQGVVAAVVAM